MTEATSVRDWRTVMNELAVELEAYIKHHYDHTLDYPSQKRKYDNEMVVVQEARKLLAREEIRQ